MSEGIFERPLPDGYRDELLALIAEESQVPQRGAGSLLLFHLGELRLAIPTRVAAGVAPVLHIARIPHRSGTVLLGLVAFRGEILPCCSLSRILDLPATQAESGTARTLILEAPGGRLWAVPIDGVLGVRLGRGTPSDVPPPIAGHWLQGSFDDGTGIFHLLDPEVLFRQITLATA